MLKKVIKYEDFNEQPREMVAYFHISRVELMEMEAAFDGGLQGEMQRVGDDAAAAAKFVMEFVLKGYGEKSEDGSTFKKTPELTESFKRSPAFDALLVDFSEHPEEQEKFLSGVLPKGLVSDAALAQARAAQPLAFRSEREVEEVIAANSRRLAAEAPAGPEGRNAFEQGPPRTLTVAEIVEMDAAELKAGVQAGRFRIP